MTAEFEALVARHQGAVCAVAYAVLRDRARSEEIAQEAFLVAWQKLPALAAPPVMPAWICGIARNLARNAARRRREVAMPDRDFAGRGTPLDAVIEREENAVAEGALAQLSDSDRELVVLYYRGDETAESVAAALGTTPVNVRKRLERARTRLRAAAAACEASLRATRPGPAFTAGCVAAFGALAAKSAKAAAVAGGAKAAAAATGAAATGAAAAAAKGAAATGSAKAAAAAKGGAAVGSSVRRSATGKLAAAAIAVGGVVVGALAWHSASAASRGASSSSSSSHAAPEPVIVATAPSATPSTTPRAVAGSATGDEAAQLASELRARRAARPAAIPPASAADRMQTYDFADAPLDDLSPLPPPPHPDRIDKATLRAAMREVQPLLIECLRSQPRVTGSLTLRVDTESEANEPAVVSSVVVAGEIGFAADAEATRCLTEAVYTIQLPTTPEASRVAFVYSLTR
ncbi:MAG TPA: sigma-70 family RNA polymerase sigma factor [Kofleriaceae bacterium]|jgi:RNA polymerase sigma factor (sigma-70 family)